ncbi:GDPmannose 4,6-dehydratase [Humibacillus xanthopallidus]|uniref:GDP-mannose 4,6-dehydratase n=1 Tax=Humibacillus xanthopallidus TaxID=412689 RepID=A0A543PXN7_9MICO|nr:GDP-mannose 4,6-dehydratase [Humibacillus xanthopallidus]TQN48836.1 GDPmannose 4,6-dehydratase [Humibacillus xanthopallidus]
MPRAFITGVAGQDGSYLADDLVASGWEVHGLVRAGDDLSHVSPQVVVHTGDLTDGAATRALVMELAPEHIYNLAGVSSVARSWEQPVETARASGVAAVELMYAARDLRDSSGLDVRFVQASSSEIFGEPAESPQTERTPVRPTNPYGAAKAFAHLSAAVVRSQGLHCSSAILFNHESPRRPTTFVSRKICAAVARIARGSSEILELGNLDARRDWGWAPDHVRALRLMASAPTAADVVVATGVAHSVRDLVVAAFAHVGVDDWQAHVRVDDALVRVTDAAAVVGDPSFAEDHLGWRATTSFEELVVHMVDGELGLIDA